MWQFREVSWGRESVLWDTVQGNFVTLAYAVVVILGTLYLVLGRMSNKDGASQGKVVEWLGEEGSFCLVPGIYQTAHTVNPLWKLKK